MGKKTKLSIVAFVIFVIGGIIMFNIKPKTITNRGTTDTP